MIIGKKKDNMQENKQKNLILASEIPLDQDHHAIASLIQGTLKIFSSSINVSMQWNGEILAYFNSQMHDRHRSSNKYLKRNRNTRRQHERKSDIKLILKLGNFKCPCQAIKNTAEVLVFLFSICRYFLTRWKCVPTMYLWTRGSFRERAWLLRGLLGELPTRQQSSPQAPKIGRLGAALAPGSFAQVQSKQPKHVWILSRQGCLANGALNACGGDHCLARLLPGRYRSKHLRS